MKIIYNSVIPFRGFIAMMTVFILWIRKEYKGSKQLGYDFFNHEKNSFLSTDRNLGFLHYHYGKRVFIH